MQAWESEIHSLITWTCLKQLNTLVTFFVWTRGYDPCTTANAPRAQWYFMCQTQILSFTAFPTVPPGCICLWKFPLLGPFLDEICYMFPDLLLGLLVGPGELKMKRPVWLTATRKFCYTCAIQKSYGIQEQNGSYSQFPRAHFLNLDFTTMVFTLREWVATGGFWEEEWHIRLNYSKVP